MVIDKVINISNKKIFIISGKKSFDKSGIKKNFKFSNCQVYYYFKKRKNPELNELKKILEKKFFFNPDFIIGIGGGSVLDLAKLAGTIKSQKINKNKISKIKFLKRCKLILVPTTAGSGSEATNFAVLYLGNKKFSITSNQMIPNQVFYFSNSLNQLKKINKISSALDILCQAIESMFSIKSNRTSLNYSRKALKLLQENIKLYFKKKSSKINKHMFLGANFAGRAIKITKTNIPHALSYFLSSFYKIEHGLAVFINLYGFLFFLYSKRHDSKFLKNRFTKLFLYFNIKNHSKNSLQILINKINKMIGISLDYEKLNINRIKNIKKIINGVNLERLQNCPVNINKKDIERIILYGSKKNI